MVKVFKKYYRDGIDAVPFTMDDIREAIQEVSREKPPYGEKNVADVRYQ